jgi:hypothetical protein
MLGAGSGLLYAAPARSHGDQRFRPFRVLAGPLSSRHSLLQFQYDREYPVAVLRLALRRGATAAECCRVSVTCGEEVNRRSVDQSMRHLIQRVHDVQA